MRLGFAKVLAMLVAAVPLHGRAAPVEMGFSTRLADGGRPITGSHTFSFAIWNDPAAISAGNLKWTETQADVPVSDGIVALALGSVAPLDAQTFASGPLFLEVTLDGTTFTPRIPILSVPFAIEAQQAGGRDLQTGIAPTGSVMAFAGATTPAGWLPCDGSAVSRTTYASLFATIGTLHGSGDGTATFNLPDYRGRFLRGVDGAAGRDPDATSRTAMSGGGSIGNAVGSVEGHQLGSHTHNVYARWAGLGVASCASIPCPAVGWWSGAAFATNDPYGWVQVVPAGGAETRPVNANVNFIIKY